MKKTTTTKENKVHWRVAAKCTEFGRIIWMRRQQKKIYIHRHTHTHTHKTARMRILIVVYNCNVKWLTKKKNAHKNVQCVKLDISRMFKQAPNTQKKKRRDKHTPEQRERKNPTSCLLILVSFASYLSTYDQSFFWNFYYTSKEQEISELLF
jgi:hypothetical protein